MLLSLSTAGNQWVRIFRFSARLKSDVVYHCVAIRPASLNNTLTTKGAVNFQSSIDESGSSTFARVAATGAVSTNGTLGTSGAETFSDSLTVVSAVGCGCGLIVSAELKGEDVLTIGGVSRIGN
jgi:hypothetical protein